MKHIPTGIVVSSQFSRSREQNRKKAREILALKIEELTAEPGTSRTAIIAEYKKNKARKKKSKSKKKYALREAAMREQLLKGSEQDNQENQNNDQEIHENDLSKEPEELDEIKENEPPEKKSTIEDKPLQNQ